MSSDKVSPEFVGFFENARQGRLAFPKCRTCGQFHWYPMPVCPHCYEDQIFWQPVAGTGEIFSYTHVRHPFDKSRRDALPYTVALISFPDAPGVNFITNIIDAAEADITIEGKVNPVFSTSKTDEPIVLFRLAE